MRAAVAAIELDAFKIGLFRFLSRVCTARLQASPRGYRPELSKERFMTHEAFRPCPIAEVIPLRFQQLPLRCLNAKEERRNNSLFAVSPLASWKETHVVQRRQCCNMLQSARGFAQTSESSSNVRR